MIRFENGSYFTYERIGEFHSEGTWIHPTRTIRSTELILVLEGTVSLQEAGTEYELKPNQMILLEPGKEHGGIRATEEKVVFYWFHFYTDLPLPFKVCTGGDVYEIKQLMKRLLHITNTPGYGQGTADALGYLIFEELVQQFREENPSNRVHINQILEYIKLGSRRNLTVSDVASHFSYNLDYMGKLFKKNLGVGLKEYIAAQRMKLAKDLLLTTDLTVKQIATELGFAQENLFIKFFLYHERISPTVFRNQYYNTHMNNR